VPLITNYDLARIKGDLAKAKQKLVQYRPGAHIPTPTELDGEPLADFYARNPHLGRAHEAHTIRLYAQISQLESEYVTAMVACGAWCYSEIIQRMESKS
jgi:hypothetical protein